MTDRIRVPLRAAPPRAIDESPTSKPEPITYTTTVFGSEYLDTVDDLRDAIIAILMHRPTWEERLAVAIERRRIRNRIRYAWQDATHRSAHAVAALRGDQSECERW